MIVERSCGWCHTSNPTTERYCRSCGHEAHVTRMFCQCPQCRRLVPVDSGAAAPAPDPDRPDPTPEPSEPAGASAAEPEAPEPRPTKRGTDEPTITVTPSGATFIDYTGVDNPDIAFILTGGTWPEQDDPDGDQEPEPGAGPEPGQEGTAQA